MSGDPVSILLVDDTPENLLALEALLEPLGHRLVSARSGEEALRRLLQEQFALILLDVQMPGLDGFETAELIKQRPRTSRVPIIFLTALSKDPANVFRGYDAGAVDYLFKPLDPTLLRAKVEVFVELHEKTRELQRQAELLREAELAEERRASEERYRRLADSLPQIVWTADPDGTTRYLNERWRAYTGLEPTRSLDDGWPSVVHPADRPAAESAWRRSLRDGDPFEAELRLRAADRTYRWHLARAFPRRLDDGEIVEWVGTATDVDGARRAEEAERFLAEAGDALGSSLDFRTTLRTVAELVVPRLADWAAVDLREDDSMSQLVLVHADPERAALVEEIRHRFETGGDGIAVRVVRSGEPRHLPQVTDELLAAMAVDATHLTALRALDLRSLVCVPLVARGEAIGAITLAVTEPDRRLGEAEARLVAELARRAGLAVENALLYREVEERAHAARVLETVGDGVFLLDRDGTIRLWNPAAQAITGLRSEDVVGRSATEAIPGWTAVAARVPVANTPGPGATATVPLELAETELWLSIAGVEFEDGTVYAFRDLTEERVLEELRRDLVATVSHELRTPLAAIYGSALTLRRPDVAGDETLREQLLGVVAQESARLAEIVNDLLLASQLDAGSVGTRPRRCDARELAESVVASARTHLPEGVTIELETPETVPLVRADPGQLRQVLANLVENAVKYSPDGGRVRVALEPRAEALRVTVSDEGLGIPPAEQKRIFEKFYRVDPNMERGIGGTGLGLYISRELVRRVGGRISVESSPGRGSTFTVELPRAEQRTEPQPTAAQLRQRQRHRV